MPPLALPAELETDLTTVERGVLGLRLAEGQALDTDHRAQLVAGMRTGLPPPKLHLDIIAYRQPAAHNRSFVRFLPEAVGPLALSFAGAPFLRDHAQRNLLARGGSILSSTLRQADDGPEILQTVELVTPWAVEAALQGLMDRFSIGWNTTGQILCSVCDAPFWEGDCLHWPGDTVDGVRVEAIVTAADGVETSAVLVPAVIGTGIESIRAAFSARLAARSKIQLVTGGLSPDHFVADLVQRIKERTMTRLTALAAAVDLPDDAPEDTILAAVEKLKGERARLDALYKTEQEAHAAAKTRADQAEAELATLHTAERDAATEKLIAACRAKVGQKLGADKQPVRGGTGAEAYLLSVAARSLEEAERFVAALPQIIPQGLQSKPQPTADGEAARREKAKRVLDDQFGLTAEDFERFGPPRRGA